MRRTRPMDWTSLSLLVVSMILVTLTGISSYVGQSIGTVFLGAGSPLLPSCGSSGINLIRVRGGETSGSSSLSWL